MILTHELGLDIQNRLRPAHQKPSSRPRLSAVRAPTVQTDTRTVFAPVTLTLTQWPWFTEVSWIFWRCPEQQNKVSMSRP